MSDASEKKTQRTWTGKTLTMRDNARNVRLLVVDYPDVERPRTRADCEFGPRPCPFVSCRHHLYLDVKPNGSIGLTFGERDVDQIPETCSLDVAARGEHTLEDVGGLLGITRERMRQLQDRALRKIALMPRAAELKAG